MRRKPQVAASFPAKRRAWRKPERIEWTPTLNRKGRGLGWGTHVVGIFNLQQKKEKEQKTLCSFLCVVVPSVGLFRD
jgi:hypothetical protein